MSSNPQHAKADRYAVIGNPIAHSRSPDIHRLFAEQTDEHITYERILATRQDFVQVVRRFLGDGGKGLNVTLPFKHDACKFVDQITELADHAGAVNTILLGADGTCIGANTDGVGLLRDLKKSLRLGLHARSILILGAGGATRGIVEPLLGERPEVLLIANRTQAKARAIADTFRHAGPIRGCGLDEIPPRPYDLILHATSAGLQHRELTLPAGLVGPHTCCYDLMYGETMSPFMQWGREQGAECVVDGFGMLLEQAAESFYLWRGKRPDTAMACQCLRPQPPA